MDMNEHMAIAAKTGGHKVKSMLEEVEQRMAGGEKVSAPPSSEQEAQNLQSVRDENQRSAQRAENE